MKKLIGLTIIGLSILAINGCGSSDSDPEEVVEEVTAVDYVDFSDLVNHRIVILERDVNDPDENEIVFCQEDMVQSGSFKNGDYVASSPEVTMTFDSAGETLIEEDVDAVFKLDEYVQFNGYDYIITNIYTAPFAVCD